MQNIIKFNNQNIEVITINGERYLNGAQIGHCLELNQKNHAVGKIYKRHHREFTPEMSIAVEMPTSTGNRLTRLYSLRGAALIAMYAQTPVATQFRAFILDVLEGKQQTRSHAEQVNTLLNELLSARPEWQKIIYYNQLGLSGSEIGKLMGKGKTTINEHLRRLTACGFPVDIRPQGGQKKAPLFLTFGG